MKKIIVSGLLVAVFAIVGFNYLSVEVKEPQITLGAATDVKNDANLSTSLVSYWELEESSGTRIDSHGSNDLTENGTGGIAQVTGIQGNAGDFESTDNDYLSIADANQTGLGFTSDFSASLWWKPESLSSAYGFVTKFGGGSIRSYSIRFQPNGGTHQIQVVMSSDGTSGGQSSQSLTLSTLGSNFSSGTWYHLAFVYDASASAVKVYQNGTDVGDITGLTSSIADTTAEFQIGAEQANGIWIDGVVDEVGMWSKTLTSTEVTDLYNSGAGIPYDGGGGGGGGATPDPMIISGYDVFLIAGQSNTYSGEPYSGETLPNPVLDSTDEDIYQIGRFDGEDLNVIQAQEPLDHVGYLGNRPPSNKVGWPMTFAKKYKQHGLLANERAILLVPTGEGGSGFDDNSWNKGNPNYNDAINRTQIALNTDTNCDGTCSNELKGILWHQGEDDTANYTQANAYEASLLQMVDDFRNDFNRPNLPFITGGMVEDWVNQDANRQTVKTALSELPQNRDYTGFANSTGLTAVTGGNPNHFSARSVRGYPTQDFTDTSTLGLAGRYFDAYLSALNNTSQSYTPTNEIWYDNDGEGCTQLETLNGQLIASQISCP